jgi:hypothetical protein
MEVTFGVLDAIAFAVIALLIVVAVILIVSLGQLPGQLARKFGHPRWHGEKARGSDAAALLEREGTP